MQKLNTTAVYILSVVGILCWCIYGLGTVAAIIAVVIAFNQLKKYNQNPEEYSNGNAMKTAKVVAIISLIISLIGLAFVIYVMMNPCELGQMYYDWAIENGATEDQLEPLIQSLEDSGCM